VLYPQNGDRIVTIDSVTSLYPMFSLLRLCTTSHLGPMRVLLCGRCLRWQCLYWFSGKYGRRTWWLFFKIVLYCKSSALLNLSDIVGTVLSQQPRRLRRFRNVSKGPIYKISYDNLTMSNLRSNDDGRLIYKTSYEGRKAFHGHEFTCKIVIVWDSVLAYEIPKRNLSTL